MRNGIIISGRTPLWKNSLKMSSTTLNNFLGLSADKIPTYLAAFSVNRPIKHLRIALIENLLIKHKLDDQLQPAHRNMTTKMSKIHSEIQKLIVLLSESEKYTISDTVFNDFCKPKRVYLPTTKLNQNANNQNSSTDDLSDLVMSMNTEIIELKSIIEEQSTNFAEQSNTLNEVLDLVKILRNEIKEIKAAQTNPTTQIQTFDFASVLKKQIEKPPIDLTSNSNNDLITPTTSKKRPASSISDYSTKRMYISKNSSKQQYHLKHFNSYDPESQNEDIRDENAGFKIVEKKKINSNLIKSSAN